MVNWLLTTSSMTMLVAPRLGDVGGQVPEQLLQVAGVGGDHHVGVGGVGGPLVEGVHVDAVLPHQANAVDDDAGGLGRVRDGGGGGTGGGFPVGEHHDDFGVGRSGVEQSYRLGEGVGVVGGAARRQGVHGGVQVGYRGDQLGVRRGSTGEADDADAAARANDTVRCAVGGLLDDLNEGFCSHLQVSQRLACHAARTVQHQYDVGGIGGDVRRGRQGQGDLQSPAAVNLIHTDLLIGACDAHATSSC